MRKEMMVTMMMVALLAGCPGETDDDVAADDDAADDDTGDDDSAEEPGLAPCTFADAPVATFTIIERSGETWSLAVGGQVWEEPYPSWHQVLRETETCRYMVYLPGSCDPPCEGGELCTADGDCVGWPTGVAAGTMTVEGLGDPVVIEPQDHAPGTYYASVSTEQFGEMAPVSVSLSGDVFPAVELAARGVEQVVADAAADGLSIPDAAPVTLTWNAGSDPGACVEVTLYTQNMGHGLPIINVMESVGPDTGMMTIPAEMTDIWPNWNTPGVCVGIDCPYSELTRYTRQIVPTEAGDAWLTVSSTSLFALLGE